MKTNEIMLEQHFNPVYLNTNVAKLRIYIIEGLCCTSLVLEFSLYIVVLAYRGITANHANML